MTYRQIALHPKVGKQRLDFNKYVTLDGVGAAKYCCSTKARTVEKLGWSLLLFDLDIELNEVDKLADAVLDILMRKLFEALSAELLYTE